MKYVDLPAFMKIDATLNFITYNKKFGGGCDLFICKAAGEIKALNQHIEEYLQTQYQQLRKDIASMSSEIRAEYIHSVNLERTTAFGSFHQASNRRTFAYLIGTLQVTYPTRDWWRVLRPHDFHRVSLRETQRTIDGELLHARRECAEDSNGACTPGGSLVWTPQLWDVIDEQMALADCEVYAWHPSNEPFADEDTPLQRFDYFFYNDRLKRVLYFYLVVWSGHGANKRADYGIGHVTDTPRRRHHRQLALAEEESTGEDDSGWYSQWSGDEGLEGQGSTCANDSVDEYMGECDDDDEE